MTRNIDDLLRLGARLVSIEKCSRDFAIRLGVNLRSRRGDLEEHMIVERKKCWERINEISHELDCYSDFFNEMKQNMLVTSREYLPEEVYCEIYKS